MLLTKQIDLTQIPEIRILNDVRLIHRNDLNQISSHENLRVQFEISGDVKGAITCYLCLDELELSQMEKNYIFPLFTESMNILVGRQISLDQQTSKLKVNLSSPKISMISVPVQTAKKNVTHIYELELATMSFNVIVESSLDFLN